MTQLYEQDYRLDEEMADSRDFVGMPPRLARDAYQLQGTLHASLERG